MKKLFRFFTEDLPASVTVFFCNGVCIVCMAAFLLFIVHILRQNDARTHLQFVPDPIFSTAQDAQLIPPQEKQDITAENESE